MTKFPELEREELSELRIVYGMKLHRDCLFLIIEAPGRRYQFDLENKDRRYLMGIVFTYPKKVQKAMWYYVVKNIILPEERKRWIKEMEQFLEQVKLDDNISS